MTTDTSPSSSKLPPFKNIRLNNTPQSELDSYNIQNHWCCKCEHIKQCPILIDAYDMKFTPEFVYDHEMKATCTAFTEIKYTIKQLIKREADYLCMYGYDRDLAQLISTYKVYKAHIKKVLIRFYGRLRLIKFGS